VFSFLKSWGADAVAPNPANDVVACAQGAPSREDLLARYASITGTPVDSHARFYEVFGLWRSIGIFEGIHARSDATRFVHEPPQLVARAKGMMAASPDPR
jgi:aminoglycoside phosphotransferase (APT) family kinase protein